MKQILFDRRQGAVLIFALFLFLALSGLIGVTVATVNATMRLRRRFKARALYRRAAEMGCARMRGRIADKAGKGVTLKGELGDASYESVWKPLGTDKGVITAKAGSTAEAGIRLVVYLRRTENGRWRVTGYREGEPGAAK